MSQLASPTSISDRLLSSYSASTRTNPSATLRARALRHCNFKGARANLRCRAHVNLVIAEHARQRPKEEKLPPELQRATMPSHVAVIMDGNARWAASRGLNRFVGHQAGLEAFKSLVTSCHNWSIPALTVFAFSSENWQRSEEEVSFLMSLFTAALRAEGQLMHRRGIRLRVIGGIERLPQQLREEVERVEQLTGENQGLQLNIALSYSGRQDIAAAAKSIAQQVALGQLDPEQVDEDLLEQHLSLAPVLQAVGPPDLLIRTSGEYRLSNFLLWELAYSELIFCPAYWPDFGERQLVDALVQYQGRTRRFGRRPDS